MVIMITGRSCGNGILLVLQHHFVCKALLNKCLRQKKGNKKHIKELALSNGFYSSGVSVQTLELFMRENFTYLFCVFKDFCIILYCIWIYNIGYAVRPTNIYLQWYTEKDNSLPFPRNGRLCAIIPVELYLPTWCSMETGWWSSPYTSTKNIHLDTQWLSS